MSAYDNLSELQFFHGTYAKLKSGDSVEPGHGHNFGPGNEHLVYATGSSGRASQWAGDAINARNEQDEDAGVPSPKRTPHVYAVKPTGPVEADWENEGEGDVSSAHPMTVLHRVVYHSPEGT